MIYGAANRTWTGTGFTPRDFKSLVSAYSTTAACKIYYNTFFAKCQRFFANYKLLNGNKW